MLLTAEKSEIKSHIPSLFIILQRYHFLITLHRNDKNAMNMENFRIGNGYDVHALAEGLPLRLGGVDIESPVGCVAHSDGDVPIHALCDAILGALALGDIGKHFPDTSDEFRGIDSCILLERTMALAAEVGYRIGNADITVALQRPRLAPYIERMRERLAGLMSAPVDAVSVKATTTEKLGFVGRGEGCEAYAVVLLVRA